MSLLADLNTIARNAGIPVETGVFSGVAPTDYLVLTPLTDTFDIHADNGPGVDVQEVRISLFTKGSYTKWKNTLVRSILAADITITERRYVGHDDDTGYVLNNFLKCSAYENIIFCWVMHEQSIINSILEKLDTQNCEVKCVSLVADEKTLCERLAMDVERGIRSEDIIERSIARIPMYQALNTIIIDTNAKNVAMIANEIKLL